MYKRACITPPPLPTKCLQHALTGWWPPTPQSALCQPASSRLLLIDTSSRFSFDRWNDIDQPIKAAVWKYWKVALAWFTTPSKQDCSLQALGPRLIDLYHLLKTAD
jgi:hypothetical protein